MTMRADLEFGEGELLRGAELGIRTIRTRSPGSELGEGELLRDVQLRVRGIRTRIAGSESGVGSY
jgi:hypothetical protein